jgi:hypothetical protein
MTLAALEKEIEQLDAAQQNAVVLFVRFLASQPKNGGMAAFADAKADESQSTRIDGAVPASPTHPKQRVSMFGALRGKIHYIAPDFDEPLEDFAEYM